MRSMFGVNTWILFLVTVVIVVGAAAVPKGGVDLPKGECVATTTTTATTTTATTATTTTTRTTTKVEFVGFMVEGRILYWLDCFPFMTWKVYRLICVVN